MDRRTLNGTTQKDSLRGLKALVIGMGVLIVLGTSLVIGLVIKRLYDAGGPRLKAASAMAVRISAPPGAMIGGVTALDGRLAIWVKDSKGGEVVLVDPRTGGLSGRVTLSAK